MTEKVKNLISRTLTGIVFVALMVGGFLYSQISFILVFGCITALSLWEYASIVNQKEEIQVNRVITTIAGVYLFLAFTGFCSNQTPSSVFIPYLLTIIYLLISELYLKNKYPLNNWAYTMLGQIYIALPLALLNVLCFGFTNSTDETNFIISYNGWVPLSIFIFLWTSDTGAYCFGSMLGKRKLFPSISPKKSWEGFLGGMACSLAISQLLATFHTGMNRGEWLGLALVVVIFGTWGDLVESLMKRQLNIKDSGHILPGHGGMLDRFDSSLLAIPASIIYLYTLSIL